MARLAMRTKMGEAGIEKSGPCFVMSCLGIAQTYAKKNLNASQIRNLLSDKKIWDGENGGSTN
jgi:hypothetical protein